MNENNDFAAERLTELLAPLDIPTMRRDITKLSNLKWLQRNVSINNSAAEQDTAQLSLLPGRAENLDTIHLLIRTLIRRGSN